MIKTTKMAIDSDTNLKDLRAMLASMKSYNGTSDVFVEVEPDGSVFLIIEDDGTKATK